MSGHRILHDALVAPTEGYDPGASGTISVVKNLELYDLASDVGAETRTLNPPSRAGIYLTIRMKEDNGDIVMTSANGLNVAGNTQATFADVGDLLFMVSCAHTTGYRWEILVNTGSVALA